MSTITPPTPPVPPAPAPAPRKKSLAKMILKLALLLMILVVIGLVILFLNLNTLVRAGIIRGGTFATEQNTTLSAADLSLSGGSLQLAGLTIENNLKGYTTPAILTMKSCGTVVQSSSLFSHTVVVDAIEIDGLEVTLEQNSLKNNIAELIEIIQKKTAAADSSSAKTSPGKQLIIHKLHITGTKVHLVSKDLGLNLELDLGPIEMTDPMNPDGRPMKIADLIARILIHLSQQIMENPAIPGNIKDQMKNVTALVNKMGPELNKNVKMLSKSVEDVTKNLQGLTTNPAAAVQNLQQSGKQIQDATKNLQDTGKNAADSVKNLLGGNKNTPPK